MSIPSAARRTSTGKTRCSSQLSVHPADRLAIQMMAALAGVRPSAIVRRALDALYAQEPDLRDTLAEEAARPVAPYIPGR
jgi:DNA-binding MurR/RpiR family transcriptional regulator